MKLEEAIEKGLRILEEENRRRWEADDADGKWHVSDLTSCPRLVLFRRRKEPPTDARPIEDVLVKEVGTQYHQLLQSAVERAGHLIRADFRDRPWTVQDDVRGLRGHPDLLTLLSTDSGLELWDIKSLKEGGYRGKFGVINRIRDDDAEQLNAYMGLTGVQRGGILYVNRNSGQYKRIDWAFDEALWRESERKLAWLQELAKKPESEWPDPYPAHEFPCTYTTKDGVRVDCSYRTKCHGSAKERQPEGILVA